MRRKHLPFRFYPLRVTVINIIIQNFRSVYPTKVLVGVSIRGETAESTENVVEWFCYAKVDEYARYYCAAQAERAEVMRLLNEQHKQTENGDEAKYNHTFLTKTPTPPIAMTIDSAKKTNDSVGFMIWAAKFAKNNAATNMETAAKILIATTIPGENYPPGLAD